MPLRVLFDTSFLSAMADRGSPVRQLPPGMKGTVNERLDYLFHRLDEQDAEIVIPALALAEALARNGASPHVVIPLLNRHARVRVAAFDQVAAIEFGTLFRDEASKWVHQDGSKSAIKFDNAIIAIAVVEGVSEIFADDDGLRRKAARKGIKASGFWDLPMPPEEPQGDMFPTKSDA